ncbi:MAG: hypothetical protein ACXACY_19840 [Candidatus Hodarchaeales archaeon]|jgi:hypothetical protein
MVEFTECPSISISYDATGKASISLSVIKDDMNTITGDYTTLNFGNTAYTLVVMSASQQPIFGSGGWAQWSLQLEGIAE